MIEASRRVLINVVSLLCFLSLGVSVSIVIMGSYTRNSVQKKIRLLENFHTSQLPIILVIFGLFSCIHNLLGCSLMFTLNRPRKRYTRMGLLCVKILAGIVLCLSFIGLAIGCHVQIYTLDKSFHGGFKTAMKSYGKSPLVKVEIDRLQIEYKCCGSNSYEDWFTIPWVKPEFMNPSDRVKSKDDYFKDDAPFSCCKINVRRPCISQSVEHAEKHYNYDPKKAVTLNDKGCRNALVEFYGHKMMKYMGRLLILLAVVQVVIILMTRLIQTSIRVAISESGDAEMEADGFLCAPDTCENMCGESKCCESNCGENMSGDKEMCAPDMCGPTLCTLEGDESCNAPICSDWNLKAKSTELYKTTVQRVKTFFKIGNNSDSSDDFDDTEADSSDDFKDSDTDNVNSTEDDDDDNTNKNNDIEDNIHNDENDDDYDDAYSTKNDIDAGFKNDDDEDDDDFKQYRNKSDFTQNAVTPDFFKTHGKLDEKIEDFHIKVGSGSGSGSGTSDSSPDSSFSGDDSYLDIQLEYNTAIDKIQSGIRRILKTLKTLILE